MTSRAARSIVLVLTLAAASVTVTAPARAAAPSNDNLASAQVLSGALPIVVSGSNVDATNEPGEPSHGTGSAASAWWQWTADLDGRVVVNTCGSTFDTLLAVYTGTTYPVLQAIAENDDSCDVQSQVEIDVISGTTYSIAVDGYAGSTGDISLSLNAVVTPPNDSFATPGILSGPLPISVLGSNEGAAREAGEPEHGAPGYLGSASVWYSWTPTESGVVTIDLCDGTDFGTLLSVYTGESLDALTAVAGDVGGCGFFSRLALAIDAGTTYRIAIDGTFGQTGTFDLEIRRAVAINDNFADATILSGPLPIVAHGTNVGATDESDEPNHGDPDPSVQRWVDDASVWYRWTATFSGPLSIDTCGSEIDSVLGVYEGTELAGLSRVAWNSGACSVQSMVRLDVVAGHTYQIAVATVRSVGPITITLRQPGPAPANDSFVNARDLRAALPITVNDSNYEATGEPGEPLHAGQTTGASIWYRWVPSRSGPVDIDTCAGNGWTELAVYTGDRLDALTDVADSPSPRTYPCAGRGGMVRFPAVARTTYWIAVDGDRGSIGLSIREAPPPANDAFAASTTLHGLLPLTVIASNIDATHEPSEPADYVANGRGASVWYSWTPSVSATIAVETCDGLQPSRFASLLGIWTGVTLDTLTRAPGQLINACGFGTSITLPVVAGQTYRVAVDSSFGAGVPSLLALPLETEGSVPLRIRAVGPPTNDALAARQLLHGPLPLTVTGTNVDATGETSEPGHDPLFEGESAARSVWYQWTATFTGPVVVESCGNDFDALVGLYEGDSVETLTDLFGGWEWAGCPGGYRIPLQVTAGTSYVIVIDGVGGDNGAFSLTLRQPSPPANDLMAHAQPLAGPLPIVAVGSNVDAGTELGEPDQAWAPMHSIWYRWTAGTDERVVIDTCASVLDTGIVVFVGADPVSGTEVGHNDKACGLGSAVDLTVVSGATYWIKVDGRDSGPVTIRVRRHAPPANDAFSNARDLGRKTAVDVIAPRVDATAEPGEPRHGGIGGGQSIWFQWTAPSGGQVTIDTCGSGIHTILGVYTGTAVDALTMTATGADLGCGLSGGSRVTFSATARTTYRIAVDAAAWFNPPFLSGGPVALHLRLENGSGAGGSRS